MVLGSCWKFNEGMVVNNLKSNIKIIIGNTIFEKDPLLDAY